MSGHFCGPRAKPSATYIVDVTICWLNGQMDNSKLTTKVNIKNKRHSWYSDEV